MFDAPVQTVIDLVDQLRDTTDDHWQIPADEARLLAQLVRMGALPHPDTCVSVIRRSKVR